MIEKLSVQTITQIRSRQQAHKPCGYKLKTNFCPRSYLGYFLVRSMKEGITVLGQSVPE